MERSSEVITGFSNGVFFKMTFTSDDASSKRERSSDKSISAVWGAKETRNTAKSY